MSQPCSEKPTLSVGRGEDIVGHRPADGAQTVPHGEPMNESPYSPSLLAREESAGAPRPMALHPGDDEIRLLIKLGAAVSVLWPYLPKRIRDEIHAQAGCVTLPAAYGQPKHCGSHDELKVWLESCRIKHL